jgi:hypothetical protein
VGEGTATGEEGRRDRATNLSRRCSRSRICRAAALPHRSVAPLPSLTYMTRRCSRPHICRTAALLNRSVAPLLSLTDLSRRCSPSQICRVATLADKYIALLLTSTYLSHRCSTSQICRAAARADAIACTAQPAARPGSRSRCLSSRQSREPQGLGGGASLLDITAEFRSLLRAVNGGRGQRQSVQSVERSLD